MMRMSGTPFWSARANRGSKETEDGLSGWNPVKAIALAHFLQK